MKRFDYACFTIREGSLTEVDRIEETTEETNFFFLCEKFEPFYREYASECGGGLYCDLVANRNMDAETCLV